MQTLRIVLFFALGFASFDRAPQIYQKKKSVVTTQLSLWHKNTATIIVWIYAMNDMLKCQTVKK